ncbi:hypothetical protein AB0I55_27115 [Actinocatenispora sera]|nr:hypothetical protein [Actinocatenispora sera]
MDEGVPVLVHATDPYRRLARRPLNFWLSVDSGTPTALPLGGPSRLTLPPGRHELRFAYPVPQDDQDGCRILVDTTAGSPVSVYYAAPLSRSQPGVVGYQPDPRAQRTGRALRVANRGVLILMGALVLLGIVAVLAFLLQLG